jgi:hypothetical protein
MKFLSANLLSNEHHVLQKWTVDVAGFETRDIVGTTTMPRYNDAWFEGNRQHFIKI